MYDVILFGGTTEGRELADFLSAAGIPSLVCVATAYGEKLLSCAKPVRVHGGRLDGDEIATLLAAERPKLVIDATHPYAVKISESLRKTCGRRGLQYIRVLRESLPNDGCVYFKNTEALVSWLNRTDGVVFAAVGASRAPVLTGVKSYPTRVFLRILPSPESLDACIGLGYPANHIICMQGPFSKALNEAMFRETGAKILVTKESGKNGGFAEKCAAAAACGMTAAVLERPSEESGLSLEKAKALITEVFK